MERTDRGRAEKSGYSQLALLTAVATSLRARQLLKWLVQVCRDRLDRLNLGWRWNVLLDVPSTHPYLRRVTILNKSSV